MAVASEKVEKLVKEARDGDEIREVDPEKLKDLTVDELREFGTAIANNPRTNKLIGSIPMKTTEGS